MAIVLNTEASNNSSVSNEMIFVAYEATKATDPTTYTDYRYTCYVYVGGELAGKLIARPDPEYNRGIFDVSKILRGQASYGLDASAAAVEYTIRGAYQLKFGEIYGDTEYTNVLVDSTDRYYFETYKPKPFTSSSVLSNGLASNMPTTVYQNREQDQILIPFWFNTSGVSDIVTTYYTEAGVQISTVSTSMTGFAAYNVKQINEGVLGLNPPATASYAILTGGTGGATDVVYLRINFTCNEKHTTYTLAWLNPYGAYESFGFSYVSKKNYQLSRKDYSQLDYQINSSGQVSYQSNNVYYGSKRTFATNVKTKLKLTSHLLNDAEYRWLADLFASPDVYLWDDSQNKFFPVKINQDYEERKYSNSKMTPLEFEVEYSDYNSQQL